MEKDPLDLFFTHHFSYVPCWRPGCTLSEQVERYFPQDVESPGTMTFAYWKTVADTIIISSELTGLNCSIYGKKGQIKTILPWVIKEIPFFHLYLPAG